MTSAYFVNPRSLVNAKEISDILKISSSTLSRMVKAKRFPPPIRCLNTKSGRPSGRFATHKWVYQDVMDFIDNLKKEGFIEYNKQRTRTQRCGFTWLPKEIQDREKKRIFDE